MARRQKILIKECINILLFRYNQFWGTYKGYRRSGPLTWQLKKSFYYPRNGKESLFNFENRREIQPISYEAESKNINKTRSENVIK